MKIMAKQTPQKSAFNEAKKYKVWLEGIKLVATILSISSPILLFLFKYPNLLQFVICSLSLILTISIFYLQRRFETIYKNAEDARRDGLIDNSFNTTLANIESKEYYDTDQLEFGMCKLLANVHENSFYSSYIVDKMFKKSEQKNFFFFLVLVVTAIFSTITSQTFTAILQTFLSINFLGSCLKLHDLKCELKQVQDNCKFIATSVKDKTFSKSAHIIREVIRYETALAYASMMFDSKFYEKINSNATNEWTMIQTRYYY